MGKAFFPRKPAIRPLEGADYVLAQRFYFPVTVCGWKVTVLVMPGFRTDGASIPRLLWRVLGHPFEADTIGAAVRHDYAYQTGRVPRKDADAAFYDNLRADGVGAVKARLFYFGVRMFGGRHYNNKKGTT